MNKGALAIIVGYADNRSQGTYRFYVLKTRSICMSRDIHWTNKLFFERDNELIRNDLDETTEHEEETVKCFIPTQLPVNAQPIPLQSSASTRSNIRTVPVSTMIARENSNNRNVFHQLANLALMM